MSKRQRRAACLAYILRERSKRYWLVPLGFWGRELRSPNA